jgi:alanine racemase
MIMVDVSGIKNVKPGDEVAIIGKSGKKSINAEDVAQKLSTINYEVVTRINPLIKRFYF